MTLSDLKIGMRFKTRNGLELAVTRKTLKLIEGWYDYNLIHILEKELDIVAVYDMFGKTLWERPECKNPENWANLLDERLLKTAVHTFGASEQISKAIEEMSELIQALVKWSNSDTKVDYLPNVREEIVDVFITLNQMKHIFFEIRSAPECLEELIKIKQDYLGKKVAERQRMWDREK